MKLQPSKNRPIGTILGSGGEMDGEHWTPNSILCYSVTCGTERIIVQSACSLVGFSQSLSDMIQYFSFTTNQHQPGLSAQKPTSEQAECLCCTSVQWDLTSDEDGLLHFRPDGALGFASVLSPPQGSFVGFSFIFSIELLNCYSWPLRYGLSIDAIDKLKRLKLRRLVTG